MTLNSYNCMICAHEFNIDDLHNIKFASLNLTKFKICESCLNLTDPANDFQEVKSILNTYLGIDIVELPED